MTDMELDMRISLLQEQAYEDYTKRGLDVPRKLREKSLTLCKLRWSKVPVKYRRWCGDVANDTNRTMKQWRKDNNAGSVAI